MPCHNPSFPNNRHNIQLPTIAESAAEHNQATGQSLKVPGANRLQAHWQHMVTQHEPYTEQS